MCSHLSERIPSALFCLALAIAGCNAAAEQEAFKKIKQCGGQLASEGKGPEITFHNVKITDDDLACVKGLRHIHTLSFEFVDITDKGLDHLLSIDRIDSLTLRKTKITQEGIKKLKQKFPDIVVTEK